MEQQLPEVLPANWLDLPLELWAHIYKLVGDKPLNFACVCK